MTPRPFRAAGEPMPAEAPQFPPLPPSNRPPYARKTPSAAVRRAVAAAEARAVEEKEGGA